MKLSIVSVLFTAVLGFVGCVATPESPDPSELQTSESETELQSVAAPDEALATCSSAGGVCRKSACRAGEVFTERLECGTDAACCIPAP